MPYFKLGMDKKLIVPYAEYMKALKPDFEYIGDTDEIVDLVKCLNLPNANSVKLVGPRGAGATVLMDALVHHQTSDFMPDDFMIRPIFKLNGNNLFSTSDSQLIETRFKEALEDLERQYRQRKVKPVLIIDDGCTFADNAPQHVINSLIEAAVRADYVDLVVGVDKKKEAEFNEKHPEFENSFTTKEVKEPNRDEIISILEHHAKKHAKKNVIIDREAIEHIVDISERFKGMYRTAQPNRAIRLLDAAATSFAIEIHSRAPGSYEKELQRRDLEYQLKQNGLEDSKAEEITSTIATLKIELDEAQAEWEKHRKKITSMQEDIRKFDVLIATAEQDIEKLDEETKDVHFRDLREALSNIPEGDPDLKGKPKDEVLKLGRDDFLKFIEFDLLVHRNPKVPELTRKISQHTEATERLNEQMREMSEDMHQDTYLPTAFIDDEATKVTKTPVGGVTGRLRENLRNGVELMRESVFGQDHVIEPIVKSLQRAAAGLNDPDRPLGAFMIAGPPGTGKSWTAEQLAVKLFGSKDYYVEINMNDYMQEHTVSDLIGAPPGFSGYGKRGRLIEIGQDKPFCVLCLDEIEKAHPDIRQALLAMKGKGYMRGLDGEEADFRNIIIVETSNFGNDKGIWNGTFEEGEAQLHQLLRTSGDVFSPEYLDRNDAILCAGPLGEIPLNQIVTKELSKMEEKAQRRHPDMSIEVSEQSIQQFVRDHCLGVSGRRSEMLINKMVGDHLTEILMSGAKVSGTLSADYNSDNQRFDVEFTQKLMEAAANQNASAEFRQKVGRQPS